MSVQWLLGNAADQLRTLPAQSVQCVCTSPPYYGLRSYDGGEAEIGQEDTPQLYVQRLVEVFRAVRRVLRDDGVLFLNLGDSWNSTPVGRFNGGGFKDGSKGRDLSGVATSGVKNKREASGLPPKNLLGIPWRVAFALQADGWYLRQDLIWAKTSCLPESVTSRFTKSHEYIFLLSKNEHYFFDNVAVKEPVAASTRARLAQNVGAQAGSARVPGKTNGAMKAVGDGETRNRRSVWSIKLRGLRHPKGRRSVMVISPKGFRGAHFAVYPPEIPEVAIRAGTSEHGACTSCGTPWQRTRVPRQNLTEAGAAVGNDPARKGNVPATKRAPSGFAQACRCPSTDVRPCIVLDPFGGAGTTSLVASDLGRDSIYIDLNPGYLALAQARVGATNPKMAAAPMPDAAVLPPPSTPASEVSVPDTKGPSAFLARMRQ